MCGIAGMVRWGGPDPEAVKRMTDSLRHRGPDDEGFHSDEFASLGHRRLSIIDLSEAGRQPIGNESGRVRLVFNGEIYDYGRIRDRLARDGHRFSSSTDSEVLAHLYEEKGEKLVEEIDGMFAFAIWDRDRERLVLGRDHMGKKPLYYARLSDGIAFASELKAFAELPELSNETSREALHAYLLLGYIPGELSIREKVRKLLPGSVAVFDRSGLSVSRFFEPTIAFEPWSMDASQYEEELLALMRRAVKRRLVADVEVGVFLSGGIDSSLISALVAEEKSNFKTFSIGFTEAEFDEAHHARRVAEALGSEHIEERFGPRTLIETIPEVFAVFDEPFADASAIPTYLLAGMTAKRVKVALAGDGGDELFGGYPTLKAQRAADALAALSGGSGLFSALAERLPEGEGYYPLGYVARRFARHFGEEPWRRQAAWTAYVPPEDLEKLMPGSGGMPRAVEDLARRWASDDSEATSRLSDQRLYLPDDILVKSDRATMGRSLEARAPFLDREVVRFANRLPRALARGKVLLKRILRHSVIPVAAEWPNQGFALPVARWLRNDLKDWARERLDAFRVDGIEKPVIERFWSEHQSRRRDRWRELWAIIVLGCHLDARGPR